VVDTAEKEKEMRHLTLLEHNGHDHVFCLSFKTK
jgi:hypothetical protein